MFVLYALVLLFVFGVVCVLGMAIESESRKTKYGGCWPLVASGILILLVSVLMTLWAWNH